MIEPHWLFPGFQFLPVAIRAELTRRWKLGHRRAGRHPPDLAVATVLDVELLSKAEMRHYVADCTTVLSETFLGLVKSIIAVKTS